MINKEIFIGRAVRDAELRVTTNGHSVATFTIAVDYGFGDNKKTEFVDIKAWRKLGEICGEYIVKGMLVYVEGHRETEQWEKDGVKQRRTMTIIETMKMLSSVEKKAQEPQEEPAAEDDSESIPF